jgi:hypothetical protein
MVWAQGSAGVGDGDFDWDVGLGDIAGEAHDLFLLVGLLFHYELGRPWSLALPEFPDDVFHYLSQGSAIAVLQDGRTLRMAASDFVLIARGEAHVLCSDREKKPFPLLDLDRPPAHLGVVRHGGDEKPFSAMICGYFRMSRPSRIKVLELLPPILHSRPAADHHWLETILQRMVSESAVRRPGQHAVLSRITEVLFVEVLRSWIKSLGHGEGGWSVQLRTRTSARRFS